MYQSLRTDRAVMAGIRESAFFSRFPESDRQRIMARAFIAPKRDLDRMGIQGIAKDRLWLIVDGYMGVYDAPVPDGNLIEILGPGEIIGLPENLLDASFNHHVAPIGRPKVAIIPAEPVRKMIEENPDTAKSLLLGLSTRLRSLINQVAALKSMTAPQRIANFLLALAAGKAGRDNLARRQDPLTFRLPFSKKLIANHLGITPESFSRSLGKLAEAGVHFDKGLVRIDNPALLHQRIKTRWRN